jgi:hypothetical protein
MKYFLPLLMIGVLLLSASPVLSDTGAGVSIPLTTTVVDALQVLDAENGNVLPTGYVLPNITLARNTSIVKSLWVRNTSTTVDYTVTPFYSVNPSGIVVVTIEGSKVVARGQTVKFDFTITGVTATNCSVSLSFKRN